MLNLYWGCLYLQNKKTNSFDEILFSYSLSYFIIFKITTL